MGTPHVGPADRDLGRRSRRRSPRPRGGEHELDLQRAPREMNAVEPQRSDVPADGPEGRAAGGRGPRPPTASASGSASRRSSRGRRRGRSTATKKAAPVGRRSSRGARRRRGGRRRSPAGRRDHPGNRGQEAAERRRARGAASHLPPQITGQETGREKRKPRRPFAASRASIDAAGDDRRRHAEENGAHRPHDRRQLTFHAEGGEDEREAADSPGRRERAATARAGRARPRPGACSRAHLPSPTCRRARVPATDAKICSSEWPLSSFERLQRAGEREAPAVQDRDAVGDPLDRPQVVRRSRRRSCRDRRGRRSPPGRRRRAPRRRGRASGRRVAAAPARGRGRGRA